MDTKWKKYSRSIGVRILLNLLLIASLIIGIVLLEVYVSLCKESYSYRFYKEHSYEEEEIQEEFVHASKEILSYVFKVQSVEVDKNNQEILQEVKEKLDAEIKNYKYKVTTVNQDGTKTVITNAEETETQLLELPICISYKGVLSEDFYVKTWRNLYQGVDTDYNWFSINQLLNEMCVEHKDYAEYISRQMFSNFNIYKDPLEEFIYNYEQSEIYDKYERYKDNTEATGTDKKEKASQKKQKIKNLVGWTEKEYQKIFKDLVNQFYEGEFLVSVPISAVLGTPKEYNITIAMNEDYYASFTNKLEAQYKTNQKEYEQIIEKINQLEPLMVWVFIFFCFFAAALMYTCGRKKGTEKVQYLLIDKIWVEGVFLLETIFLLLGAYFYEGFLGLGNLFDQDIFLNNQWQFAGLEGISSFFTGGVSLVKKGLFVFVPTVIIFFMFQLFLSLVRRWKGKKVLATSLFVILTKKLCNFIEKVTSSGKLTIVSVVLAVILPIFYGIVILMDVVCLHIGSWLLVLLLTGFLFVSWIGIILLAYLKSNQLQTVCDGVKRVKSGNIQYQIKSGGTGILEVLAEDINSLSDGLENAVNEVVKSERLKTELISNVSHDIKTPLTSIITYVDLLKKEEVEPEKAKEYIQVLDQKSQRLKFLTDDLFEAAKATSGAMAVDLGILDLGSLVQQGIGEFTEKLEKSELEVRNEISTEQYYVKADGRLLWRVLENIMSNISKYALPKSRIYFSVEEQENNIKLTVKNISAYELNISAEELMERFTRGDRARNSEGSGLGLNIAKSLTELQQGQFMVEIDGDLFKVYVTLPKAKKQEENH